MGKGQRLYVEAKKLIPGGTQLLSKRPEMFLPGLWPSYYSKSRGCEVWDLDGKKYTDMSYMGIGSCVLGYADPDVNRAVAKAVKQGSMSTLNAPEEVELARLLIRLHPWADMARFARTGGEIMSIAVRLARAASGKDIVLFCGYHGWHDWYLSANLASNKALDGHLLPGLNPLGVSRTLKGTSFPFKYNDTEGFLRLAARFKGRIGAIVLEAVRNAPPEKQFLSAVKSATVRERAALVVDEITSGFRLTLGGAHLLFGLEPDLAVFAKGISNGFPMAAVIGKKRVMQAAQDSFISSTYWTDRTGPAAALATIRKMQQCSAAEHLRRQGTRVLKGWENLARVHGVRIETGGVAPLGHFSFCHASPLALKTLFTQFMLEEGFLATTAFYASYAHKDRHVDMYLAAADRAFAKIAEAVSKGTPEKLLKGQVCHSGFKRLT